MATKKKAAKPAAKKPAKPVKAATKKAAPAKKPVKPAPKKAVKPVAKAKPAAAKAKKPAPKPVAKKAVPVKKAAKPIVKPVSKKPVPVKTPAQKPMAKKVEAPKPEVKPAAAKSATPVKSEAAIKAKDIKVAPPKPVVIPKITTKTTRKYQPDFTKSVLDQPKNDPGAPIVRYSDADLAEFRELIQRKLESAKKELAYLQGLITRKDEMGGDNDDARYMTMEDGSMSMEREQLSQMASRQITFIDHLEKALMRIENKTYGICRVTGKLIDKARLRAVPHATLSIEAKMGSAK
ncbi:TraR/DksA family transcriptional regulator [Ferruginibacter sp.]